MTEKPSLLAALAAAPRPSLLGMTGTRLSEALNGDPEVWRRLIGQIGGFAVNLVIAVLILAVTLWASRWAARMVRRALDERPGRRPADRTLLSFAGSLARWVVIVVGLIAVLQQLGVQATSILAVLGAASLAVGLALQGALSNVAAGVMILILRPYRVGDVVEIDGRVGTVKALDLFVTQLADGDNLDVFVPNGRVFGQVIINYSTPTNRRMELHYRIDLGDDLGRALAVLQAAAEADPRVLASPAPHARATAITDSAVLVSLFAWTLVGDNWTTRLDLLRRGKEDLDAAGFSPAYPRQVAMPPPEHRPGSAPAPASRPSLGASAGASDAPPLTDAPSQS